MTAVAQPDTCYCICAEDDDGDEHIVRMVYSIEDAQREVVSAAYRGVTCWFRRYEDFIR